MLLIFFILNVSFVFAGNIPEVLLHQKGEDYGWKPYRVYPANKTALVDWELSSEDEVKLIVDNFVKNSEAQMGISYGDLKTMPMN